MSVFGFSDLAFMGAVGGSAALWTPSLTATLLWLDAADASTITTVSGAVSQWNDKSGNNQNATQSTAHARPSYGSTSLNGISTVAFDGSNDWLNLPENSWPLMPVSSFIVCKFNSTSLAFSISAKDPNRWYAPYVTSGNFLYTVGANPPAISTAASTAFRVHVVQHDSSRVAAYLDGSLVGQGASQNSGSTQRNNIGSYNDGASEFLNGEVAEILFISDGSSDSLRQQIEGYLAHKWGLTANLPSDHPYKLAAPTA